MYRKITEHVYSVGVKDTDRRLFDSLVYMPDGTTYNSFYIDGSTHNALIDCCDPTKQEEYLSNIQWIPAKSIDYLVLLHAEQDHSGVICTMLERYPHAQIICTDKVKQFIQIHFNLGTERITIVKPGDILDLGGMTMKFYSIPFAHWPDNTMVHLMPQNILFSSDLFGAHNSKDDMIRDIQPSQYQAARSYYSEIMMPFRKNLRKYIETSRTIQPFIIAPAHGPIWMDPERILNLYDEWTSDHVQPLVTIPYVTMHESTQIAVNHFAEQLRQLGIQVSLRDLTAKPENLIIKTGEMIYDLVDAAAVVFAFPTVLGGPHPAIAYAAITANAMMPKTIVLGMLCSYAWASKATDVLNSITPSFRCDRMDPLLFKGLPDDDDLRRVGEYATELAGLILSCSQ